MADQARAQGMRVIEIYTPHATWDRVKANAQDANLLVYFGHGNGFPSRYGPTLHEDTQDGLGLNRVDGGSSSGDVKYWGAGFVRSGIKLAPHAVAVLYRLCYASGNAESGIDAPELASRAADVKVAIQRVDNFASGFLAAGAGAVFAWGWPQSVNLPRELAMTDHSMDKIFEDRGNRSGSPNAFIGTDDYRVASRRTPGATLHLDPHATYGHLRALSGDLGMTASQWRGVQAPRDTTPPEVTDLSITVASATTSGGDGVSAFSPNGDGVDDRLAVHRTVSEGGTLDTSITDANGVELKHITEAVDSGPGATSWDGTNADGARVADGLYTLRMTPTDRSGNVGATRSMPARVLTALRAPAASASAIEVRDGDALASSVRFDAVLSAPAAVSWKVVDAAGNLVRSGPDNPAAAPGDLLWNWDGRDNQGAPVADGTYQGLVSATTAAGTIAYGRLVYVGAFQVSLNVAAPKAGHRFKITVLNTELLSGPLQLRIKQKGFAAFTLTLKKINDHRYVASLTLKSGGPKGPADFTLTGSDVNGGAETLSFRERVR